MYNEFQFKPSRLMYLIHGFAFLALQCFLYAQLKPTFWVICFILHLIASLFFLYKIPKAVYLAYLDDEQWTLIIQHKTPIKQRIIIQHMIDHLLYIVVYFESEQQKQSIIIWQDQLDSLHWKGLKTRAKFRHFQS